MDSATWLERYLEGDHDGVWHEIRQYGDRVRAPEHIEAAQAVCDEAARRARSNVELIVERLAAQGYRFHNNDDAQTATTPFLPATAGAVDRLAWLEATMGTVPLIVSSWVRLVGDVWLVGTHPKWLASSAADPLVVELEGTRYPDADITGYFLEDFESWRDDDRPGLFQLPLAPDHFHKANISGGAPYGLVLPDPSAAGWFMADTESSFVAYLRRVFRHGGFPRDTGDQAQWSITDTLAKDLLEL